MATLNDFCLFMEEYLDEYKKLDPNSKKILKTHTRAALDSPHRFDQKDPETRAELSKMKNIGRRALNIKFIKQNRLLGTNYPIETEE